MLHFPQPNPTDRHIPSFPPSTADNPNRPFDLRVTSYLSRVLQKATEPSALFGMIAAGALFRVANVAALTGLTSLRVASFWTKGFGAQTAAGLTAFGVEGAAFPVASHLAAKSMGRDPEWNDTNLISSYIFLGGLRAGGLAARTIAGLVGSKTALSSILFHEVGMFGGLHFGHFGYEWARAAGLPLPSIGSLSLAESLAMLVDFNVAGLAASKILGSRLAAWERAMIDRAKQKRDATPENLDRSFLDPELAIVGGGKLLFRRTLSRPQDERGPTRSLMSSTSESGGGSGYDQTGIEILRPLKNLEIPRDIPLSTFIRDWIKAQTYPIAVAMKARRFQIIPRIIMVNKHFETVFDWPETLIRGASVRDLFRGANITLSRILSTASKSMMGRPVEFEPTPIQLEVRFGDKVPCIGAGVYLTIENITYAFGIFTEIPNKTALGRPIIFPPPKHLPLPPEFIESLRGSPKFIYPEPPLDYSGVFEVNSLIPKNGTLPHPWPKQTAGRG